MNQNGIIPKIAIIAPKPDLLQKNVKGHPPSADLRYGEDDSISTSTLICAARKGSLGIYTLFVPPDVPKKLALRGS